MLIRIVGKTKYFCNKQHVGYASVWYTLTAKYQTFVGGVSAAVGPGRAARPAGSSSWQACVSSAGTPVCQPHFCIISASTTHSPNHTTMNPSTTLFHVSFNTSLNIRYCLKVFSRATLESALLQPQLKTRPNQRTVSYWSASLNLLQFLSLSITKILF